MLPLRTPYFKNISMGSCRTNCSEFRESGCRRSKRARRKETLLGSLILQPADALRLSGQWIDDEANVLERRVIIGRIIAPAEVRKLNQVNESKRHDDQGDLAMVDFR